MEKFVEIKGVKVHYEISGNADDTVVLMHGWGCNLTTLASLTAVAQKAGKTTLSIDFPGFGQSEEPEAVWGVEEYTALMEELLQRENITNPILLGHSFGGRVGILYASRNRVKKLILVDAAGVKPKRSMKYYLKVYSFKASKMIMKLVYGKEKAAERIERQRAKRGSSDYQNASPKMRSILSKVVNEDLQHVMPSIKAPTLLIWGENDTATPLSDAKTMARLIPDCGLVSFPNCGHYSFLDNPRQTAAVLTSFLTND
ncbi:MAG: alpha/beta hydrolase [Muribaculaceae bacterium]|nr:alpha/beta hydrolase [Muribaculaceae bacterium]